jgi:tRNA pseudouridine38-40 synthase
MQNYKYKAIVAYDGTDFYGWQIQPLQKTIVGTLQNTFKTVFKQQIKILGSSRTDAGVHAIGQVFSFACSLCIPVNKMTEAWNAALPVSITIRSLQRVADTFHPQHNVGYKTYCYYLFYRKPLPHAARYGLYCGAIDIIRLRDALQCMVGEHDFRPLSVVMPAYIKTVRRVDSIRIIKNPIKGSYAIVVCGKGFLRYMVRRMIGAALECARGRCSQEYIKQVLQNSIIINKLPVAPPQGLFLVRIVYTNKAIKLS